MFKPYNIKYKLSANNEFPEFDNYEECRNYIIRTVGDELKDKLKKYKTVDCNLDDWGIDEIINQ